MDYEKKYNEALERARQVIHTDVPADTGYEYIFPELRESKDERIRKAILGLTYIDGIEPILTKCSITAQDIRAYLEKQKKPTFISDLPPDDKGEPGENGILEKQQEQKPVEWSEDERIRKEIIDIVKAYRANCVYEGTHHFDECLAWLEKQKEFTHSERFTKAREEYEVEWGGKEVVDIDHWSGGDDAMLESILSDINYATPPHKKGNDEYIRKIAWVKSLRPQPEQEWSEEDRDRVAQYLHDRDGGMLWSKATEITRDILDMLCPQPKAGLTLFDENIIKAAVAFVEQNDHFNCWGGVDKHTVIKALRSLKPHWKPSEEQMEALNALNCHGDLSYVGQQNQLISLYNDLKKLI